MGLSLGALQEIALGSDRALQGHNDFFADGIDGRVGDLSKELLEIIVNQTRLIGKTGQCRVVAHRAHRIALLRDQGQQHELKALKRIAEGLKTR